jgi:hypothetical protein
MSGAKPERLAKSEDDMDIFDNEDGRYCLTIVDTDGWPDDEDALFVERGLHGGGYTWAGIVASLVEMECRKHGLN